MMEHKVDYCSAFPDYWVRWIEFKKWDWRKPWVLWERFYIGHCCKIHDETWKISPFYKCLAKDRVVFTSLIVAGGTLGVWFWTLVGLVKGMK